MGEEEIKKVVGEKINREYKEKEWRATCPFCGKETIILVYGIYVSPTRFCKHWKGFNKFIGEFIFRDSKEAA